MDRLTTRTKYGAAYYKKCVERCEGEPGNCINCEVEDEICDRLAAYEDAGLTPEVCQNYKIFKDEAISKGVTFARIVELMNADAEGRLLVLPCKAGDSFFRIERFCDEYGELEEAERHWGSDCEYCCKPCNGELKIAEYSFANIRHIIDTESAIGKTVFLTREEAEAALERGKQ